jgi:nucleotide-binding universal stress UspA family protein
MKKIIYTTDYSSNSIAALQYAASLGKSLNTDVIVLHVYPPEEEERSKRNEVIRKHQDTLEAFCQEHLQKDFETTELSFAAIKGANVAEAIADFLRDMKVYLLVMGASRTGTLKEVFLSSTTKQVTAALPFPVLAVPSDYKAGEIKKVIFSSLFNDEDIEQLGELLQIMEFLKPNIEVVHITHKAPEPAKQALQAFQKKLAEKISYKNIHCRSLQSEDVYGTLKTTIQEEKPDVVVFPEGREKNEVDRMLIREKIKGVQTATGVPLICFPPRH